METACDMKKKVSNLESVGRKICSDLRNFQKERIILSREAKCLLREFEKGQQGRRHYGKKDDKKKICTCAIWESDIKKGGESDIEKSRKMQNEEKNNCNCCANLDHESDPEDSFEVCKCSSCRYNELGEAFHSRQSITLDNYDEDDDDDDDDDDDEDDDYDESDDLYVFDEKDLNENNMNYQVKSCKTCVFCQGKVVSFSNNKLNVKNELAGRQRGGGGKSDSELTDEKSLNLSICTCSCDICSLRNKEAKKPPCCIEGKEQFDRLGVDTDYDENLQDSQTIVSEISDIHQYCKIAKMREALEKLKNCNHTLRKLLKQRDCLLTSSMERDATCKFHPVPYNHFEDRKKEEDCRSHREECRESPRELVAILKILQSKCRTKDGMIVALADELKECASNDRIKRILDKLTDANIDREVVDFDRSTLWKYLVSKQFNIIGQQYYRGKSIVTEKSHSSEILICFVILSFIFLAKIEYQCRCTATLIFRTTSDMFHRAYEIFRNFKQCYALRHVFLFIIDNSVSICDTFLASVNCRNLVIRLEKLACDLGICDDDAFPWLCLAIICATIFILLSYRACYPFVVTSIESLQNFCDTRRSDVRNECE